MMMLPAMLQNYAYYFIFEISDHLYEGLRHGQLESCYPTSRSCLTDSVRSVARYPTPLVISLAPTARTAPSSSNPCSPARTVPDHSRSAETAAAFGLEVVPFLSRPSFIRLHVTFTLMLCASAVKPGPLASERCTLAPYTWGFYDTVAPIRIVSCPRPFHKQLQALQQCDRRQGFRHN